MFDDERDWPPMAQMRQIFTDCRQLSFIVPNRFIRVILWAIFHVCSELIDVYCYAEKVPSTKSDPFDGSYPEYITLHVPDASVDSYKATAPWSSFGKIVALTEDETGIDELKGENFVTTRVRREFCPWIVSVIVYSV